MGMGILWVRYGMVRGDYAGTKVFLFFYRQMFLLIYATLSVYSVEMAMLFTLDALLLKTGCHGKMTDVQQLFLFVVKAVYPAQSLLPIWCGRW